MRGCSNVAAAAVVDLDNQVALFIDTDKLRAKVNSSHGKCKPRQFAAARQPVLLTQSLARMNSVALFLYSFPCMPPLSATRAQAVAL